MVKCLKEVIIHQAVSVFYHACFQSPMKYSITFWLTDIYSKNFAYIKELIHFDFWD